MMKSCPASIESIVRPLWYNHIALNWQLDARKLQTRLRLSLPTWWLKLRGATNMEIETT